MTNSQRLAIVRSHLLSWLGENGSERDSAAPQIVSESILIRDGFYSGRSFHAAVGDQTFRAIWFMEPDELKIRNAQGDVVAAFQGGQIKPPEPQTAVADSPQVASPISLPMPQPAPAAAESHQGEQESENDPLPKAA